MRFFFPISGKFSVIISSTGFYSFLSLLFFWILYYADVVVHCVVSCFLIFFSRSYSNGVFSPTLSSSSLMQSSTSSSLLFMCPIEFFTAEISFFHFLLVLHFLLILIHIIEFVFHSFQPPYEHFSELFL
uniref:Uncharacterized protein n=1 Tax=Pipistrellus kuhlii TaxID=59472 RepID=A0A7J7SPF4_PIPKU|nr:hypothetical protein mPipKuh1_009789 [Pipistrellus kuhlii]